MRYHVPTNRPMGEGMLAVPVSERDHIQGPFDTPLTLLEYGDYECPFCGEAYPVVKAIQEALGGELRFVFRNFPLTNMHPHAEHAAEAAEAAGEQGSFWEMHDMLYENQDALDDESLAQYAAALGLDAHRLIREVLAGAHVPRIREDFMSGVRSGVNGTPTFFMNGVRYDGPRDPETMIEALQHIAHAAR
ncbi:DsbA family protein [Verrucomicrobiota bacterium sgz303538]